MTYVIPIHRARDEGNDLFEEKGPEQQFVDSLEHHFPRLCNDVAMLVQRPFKLHWDPTTSTASTDCKAEIFLSPGFFLNGQEEVGYGTVYHEAGHILWSSYGVDLLRQAFEQGGEILKYIANIVLDRKDDIKTAQYAPGFAPTLRKRLAYICTMTRREMLSKSISERLEVIRQREAERGNNERLEQLRKKYRKGTRSGGEVQSDDEVTRLLKGWKPLDPYEDFFFAAKWHKRPRLRVTHKAMKYLARERLLNASPAELLWTCKRIREILGDPKESDTQEQENRFKSLMVQFMVTSGASARRRIDPKLARALAHIAQQYVATVRASGMERLLQRLKSMPTIHPGPISVGVESAVPVKKVASDPSFAAQYQMYLAEVQSYVDSLTRTLRRLDTPSEFTIYGQDEGELDLMESARIATGLSGFHQETVTERNIDAAIHLAIDCSGSMTGEKVEKAKAIAALFTEALLAMEGDIEGRIWGFSSAAIYDFGAVSQSSAMVQLEGEAGNSDTHMLRHVGAVLSKSQRRRKVLLVLADDGPDNMKLASKISQQLMSRGIITVHMLVGVHGTPDIYPFELIYTSMEDCLAEFGNLLEVIIKNLK